MADVIKKATRESYGEALVELGKKYDNIVVLDADLAAATKTGTFTALICVKIVLISGTKVFKIRPKLRKQKNFCKRPIRSKK